MKSKEFTKNKKMDIERTITSLIDNRLDECCSELRKNNKEYKDNYELRKEIIQKLSGMELGEDLRTTINDYITASFSIAANEQSAIYLKGFRDAIALLKSLDLING